MDEETKKKYVSVGRQDWMLPEKGMLAVSISGIPPFFGPQRFYACGWGEQRVDDEPIEVMLNYLPPKMDGCWEVWNPETSFPISVEVLLKQLEPIVEGAKYAIVTVMDQTIGYMCRRPEAQGDYFDVEHEFVALFDSLEEAEAAAENDPYKEDLAFLAVYDEEEFRKRPPTW